MILSNRKIASNSNCNFKKSLNYFKIFLIHTHNCVSIYLPKTLSYICLKSFIWVDLIDISRDREIKKTQNKTMESK